MKAILKYGQFTSMIELPNFIPTVSIIKPPEVISMIPVEELSPDKLAHTRLTFMFRERLSEDIYLYEFGGES